MFDRFICCFKPRNVVPPVVKLTTTKNKNIEEICVRVIDDQCFKPSPDKKTLGLLDTKSLYDSTEWLNKLDKNIDWKDTVQFVPPVEKGVVIKVYDGDTITIASKLPYLSSPLYRFSVRLSGIDCPEIKGKDENEKQCAQIAKQEMSDLIMNKIVTLKNIETEKFGRILADVYMGDLHLNKHMIEKRLAVTYDGGTKISPKNWMNYYCNGEL
jgi:endonuclease YncB( thermonuclease family)